MGSEWEGRKRWGEEEEEEEERKTWGEKEEEGVGRKRSLAMICEESGEEQRSLQETQSM